MVSMLAVFRSAYQLAQSASPPGKYLHDMFNTIPTRVNSLSPDDGDDGGLSAATPSPRARGRSMSEVWGQSRRNQNPSRLIEFPGSRSCGRPSRAWPASPSRDT